MVYDRPRMAVVIGSGSLPYQQKDPFVKHVSANFVVTSSGFRFSARGYCTPQAGNPDEPEYEREMWTDRIRPPTYSIVVRFGND
jgi:hypothetical protein